MFQWNPDHMSAATHYDTAAAAYKTAEEFDSSIQAFMKVCPTYD